MIPKESDWDEGYAMAMALFHDDSMLTLEKKTCGFVFPKWKYE